MGGRILGGPWKNLSLAEDFIVPLKGAGFMFLMKGTQSEPDFGDICDTLKGAACSQLIIIMVIDF